MLGQRLAHRNSIVLLAVALGFVVSLCACVPLGKEGHTVVGSSGEGAHGGGEESLSVELQSAGGRGMTGDVRVKGQLWLQLDANSAAFVNGKWLSQIGGGLKLLRQATDSGLDQYGKFVRSTLIWALDTDIPAFSTELRTYPGQEAAVFTAKIIIAGGMSMTNDTQNDWPILNFPSFYLSKGAVDELGYAYYHGLWPQPVVSKNLKEAGLPGRPRRHEGPLMFTDMDRSSLLIGPLDDPLNTVFATVKSLGGNTQGSESVLAFGPSAKLSALPENYTWSVALVYGDGPTACISRYGKMVLGDPPSTQRDSAGITLASRLVDPFVHSITAWTDNGAYYFYAGDAVKRLPPAATALPAWVGQLRASDVAVSGLQLDGWWMNATTSAPNDDFFPNWSAFREALKSPKGLLFYKAYFAGDYDLFQKHAKTQSPKGCWYPIGESAFGFFSDLFDAFLKLGMTSYETDFMSDHLLPTLGLANHTLGLRKYHEGLARAAFERKVPVQFCMPTVCQVLAAAKFPAVTNARVSTDYATERAPGQQPPSHWVPNYFIGLPSMLLWSIGLRPSKDIVATSHKEPGGGIVITNRNVELDYALAVLSCGPVGLADGINMSNVTLILSGIRKDGVILKPSKPLTAVDSTFVPRNHVSHSIGTIGFLPLTVDGECSSAPCSPTLDQTHTEVSLMPEYGTALGANNNVVVSYMLLSMRLASFVPPTDDLFPALSSTFRIGGYREWRWRRCIENKTVTADSHCLKLLDVEKHGLPDVSSGPHRSTAEKGDAWRLFHFFPALPVPNQTVENWLFMGEVSKIVPLSPHRFDAVGVVSREGGSCLQWKMSGKTGEDVTVGAVAPSGMYLESSFTINAMGSAVFHLCHSR